MSEKPQKADCMKHQSNFMPFPVSPFVICFLVVLISGCSFTPASTPASFEDAKDESFSMLQGGGACGLTMPAGISEKHTTVLPGSGSDTVAAKHIWRVVIFDSASPVTLESHDKLLLMGANPSGYRFERIGPDLLICGKPYWHEILLVRHYCYDASANPAWNNQIEEITFPIANETWLADDIYDALSPDQEFPSPEHIMKAYKIRKKHAKSAAEKWRVRPFRDVLPHDWFATISCNRDLENASGE